MGRALPTSGSVERMEWIIVSPEMTLAMGHGPIGAVPLPADPVIFDFQLGGAGAEAAVRIGVTADQADHAAERLQLFLARDALLRLGGRNPEAKDCHGYHLPSELRAIALALRDCPAQGESRKVYRLAKSIELMCETIRLVGEGNLVPLAPEGDLSFADTRRLMMARRMIDERWHEKLTLEQIARTCGLNRAKLTSGFRDLFACSIAEALAERRLSHASRMLLTTDKPVSSIGYENGYLNNASFARAFSRRFGVSPSSYRSCGVAA